MYHKFEITNGTVELHISEIGGATRTTQVVKVVMDGDDKITTNDYIDISLEDVNLAFPPPNKTKLNEILSPLDIEIP